MAFQTPPLADWYWKQLRKRRRMFAGYACERCGISDTMAVEMNLHHEDYTRGKFALLDDTKWLCRWCHEFIHGLSSYDPADQGPVPELWDWGEAK